MKRSERVLAASKALYDIARELSRLDNESGKSTYGVIAVAVARLGSDLNAMAWPEQHQD